MESLQKEVALVREAKANLEASKKHVNPSELMNDSSR
jgi:hypothetical protein